MRQIDATPRARDRHVHEAPLLFEPVGFRQTVLVRKKSLLQSSDEDGVELEALGRVHGHQLQGRTPGLGLRIARFKRRVREKGRQRIGSTFLKVARAVRGWRSVRIRGLEADRRVGGKPHLAHEIVRGGDQLLQVFDAIPPVLFRLVVREQARMGDHMLHRFRQRQVTRLELQSLDQPDELQQRAAALAAHRTGHRGLPQ